jgi:MFS family permease
MAEQLSTPLTAEEDDSQPEMLPLMRLLAFLQAFNASGLLRAGGIYLLDRGMDVDQIGQIEAATLFVPLLTNPLWGMLCDRFRRRKLVTNSIYAFALVQTGLLAVPSLGCKDTCFWSIACLLTGIAAFGGNSEGALAAFTLDFLGSRRQSEYGKIRCFTSVGWGLSSAIIGVVTSRCGFVYCLYGYVRGAQSNCGGHAQCHPSPILGLGAPVLAVGHRNAANGAAAGLPPPPDARRAQPQR